MIMILRQLEPWFAEKHEVLIEELDQVLNSVFVMKGSFFVGYEINKKKRYKLHFKGGT